MFFFSYCSRQKNPFFSESVFYFDLESSFYDTRIVLKREENHREHNTENRERQKPSFQKE